MDELKPLFTASAGDAIRAKASPNGAVVSFFAVLERVGGGGGNQANWDATTLQSAGGGTSTVVGGVNGYNVVFFPDFTNGGSLDVSLAVGPNNANATLTANNSAGWRIFVF